MNSNALAEVRQELPFAQIGRTEKLNDCARCQGHDPLTALFAPKYLGVPEIGNAQIFDHRVTVVHLPVGATISAVGEALHLLVVLGVMSEYRNQRRMLTVLETRRVVFVNDGTAGEDKPQPVMIRL